MLSGTEEDEEEGREEGEGEGRRGRGRMGKVQRSAGKRHKSEGEWGGKRRE